MGILDGQDIEFKEKKIPIGVDFRNDFSGWNISVKLDPKEKKFPVFDQ